MIFQQFGNKIYYNEQFYDSRPAEALQTWAYSPRWHHPDVRYAKYLCDTCLENAETSAQQLFSENRRKIQACLRSAAITGIHVTSDIIFDIIPKHIIIQFLTARESILRYIFQNISQTDYEYNLRLEVDKLLYQIARQEIIYPVINHYPKTIRYRLFGTKTGRLGMAPKKGSFPILTLPRKERSKILPHNHQFITLDYNSFECRILLALCEQKQPEDPHEYHRQLLGLATREEAKRTFYSWLYDPRKHSTVFQGLYDREKLIAKHWDGENVTNLFGWATPCSNSLNTLNYLLQSTGARIALEAFVRVFQYLDGYRSFVAWMNHDSITIDHDKTEDLSALTKIFAKTAIGDMMVNVEGSINKKELKS